MYASDTSAIYWQTQVYEWGPRILGAIAILVIAYMLARAAKWAIAKVVDRVPALRRHTQAEPEKTLGGLIGDIAFWLILLIGITVALQPLGLARVLAPVQSLTGNTLAFIPNLIGAILIFAIGFVIAKIVREIVQSALLAANADRWLQRTGLVDGAPGTSAQPTMAAAAPPPARTSLSTVIATLVFYLIMIPVTIMALDALRIDVISEPATEMLRTILDALPKIVGALILLAIGYIVGKLAKQFIEQLLPSAGFDRAVATMGFSPESTTPSRTVGTVVMIAILLFFSIKAAELLQSPIIAIMIAQVLELGGKVLFGTAIILAGVVIARVVARLVSGAGSESWLSAILKWSIIALAVAIGLRFMGLANEIVIIAFASIIGSAAVACALAFGLGGRPTAHKLLERWTEENRAPAPPRRSRTPSAPPASDNQPPLV